MKIIFRHPQRLSSHVYQAIIKELERLEYSGNYVGNGHRLAQRLAEMVTNSAIEKKEKLK